jgi:hypothetical protein
MCRGPVEMSWAQRRLARSAPHRPAGPGDALRAAAPGTDSASRRLGCWSARRRQTSGGVQTGVDGPPLQAGRGNGEGHRAVGCSRHMLAAARSMMGSRGCRSEGRDTGPHDRGGAPTAGRREGRSRARRAGPARRPARRRVQAGMESCRCCRGSRAPQGAGSGMPSTGVAAPGLPCAAGCRDRRPLSRERRIRALVRAGRREEVWLRSAGSTWRSVVPAPGALRRTLCGCDGIGAYAGAPHVPGRRRHRRRCWGQASDWGAGGCRGCPDALGPGAACRTAAQGRGPGRKAGRGPAGQSGGGRVVIRHAVPETEAGLGCADAPGRAACQTAAPKYGRRLGMTAPVLPRSAPAGSGRAARRPVARAPRLRRAVRMRLAGGRGTRHCTLAGGPCPLEQQSGARCWPRTTCTGARHSGSWPVPLRGSHLPRVPAPSSSTQGAQGAGAPPEK